MTIKTTALITILGFLFPFFAQATLCIAHRGNNHEFFENSISAIRSAVEIKSHGVEFDVHHTKDEIALVSHDKTLKRLAQNKPGKSCPLTTKISSLYLFEIQNNCLLKNGEEIPTLEEVFYLLEGSEILRFIEFKDRPSNKTLDLIEDIYTGRGKLIHLLAFKKKNLKVAWKRRKKNSFWKDVKYFNLNFFWQNPFSKYDVDVHKISPFIFLSKLFGRKVAIYTIDKLDEMKKFFKKRIHFLTTNRPKRCLQILSSL